MNISKLTAQRFVQDLREERRQRRAALLARRALVQELSSYRTPGDIDDLLGVIRYDEGAEAEQIREILLNNLAVRAA